MSMGRVLGPAHGGYSFTCHDRKYRTQTMVIAFRSTPRALTWDGNLGLGLDVINLNPKTGQCTKTKVARGSELERMYRNLSTRNGVSVVGSMLSEKRCHDRTFKTSIFVTITYLILSMVTILDFSIF